MEERYHAESHAKEDWDWWHAGRRRALTALLRPFLPPAEDDGNRLSVFDLGCGTGGTGAHLVGGHRLFGCDLSRDALGFAARRGRAGLVRAGARRLPWCDGAFDWVFCLDGLEHHQDDREVARELRRVLKPGGRGLFTVPAFQFLWGPHDVLSHHYRRYRLGELTDCLEDVGFEVMRATYFNTFLFPVAAAVQLGRRALRGSASVEAASDLPEKEGGLVNTVLREVFAAEAHWLTRADFPFGVSAVAVVSRGERP
ncbi:MAG: class I SAM-dependent methyltransferase [Acidobacteriota bacterium]